MRHRWLVVAVAVSLASAGCGFFSKTKSKFYSLETIPPAAAPAMKGSGLPIGIDSVELPPGFDRRDIVVRKADLQLEMRGTEQWSASLEPMVTHTLAFDLARRLPEGMVVLPGEAKPASMRAIDVIVEELVAGPDNRVTLDAHWVLREGGASIRTTHEAIAIDIASLDSTEVAAGVSKALAALADRIAAGL